MIEYEIANVEQEPAVPKGTKVRLGLVSKPNGSVAVCALDEIGFPLIGGHLVAFTREGELYRFGYINPEVGMKLIPNGMLAEALRMDA